MLKRQKVYRERKRIMDERLAVYDRYAIQYRFSGSNPQRHIDD